MFSAIALANQIIYEAQNNSIYLNKSKLQYIMFVVCTEHRMLTKTRLCDDAFIIIGEDVTMPSIAYKLCIPEYEHIDTFIPIGTSEYPRIPSRYYDAINLIKDALKRTP